MEDPWTMEQAWFERVLMTEWDWEENPEQLMKYEIITSDNLLPAVTSNRALAKHLCRLHNEWLTR